MGNRRTTVAAEGFRFDKWYLERPTTLGLLVLEQLRDACFQQALSGPEGKPAASYGLLYCMMGEGTLAVGGRELAFGERAFTVTFPGEAWSVRCAGEEPVRCVFVSFQLAAVPNNPFQVLGKRFEPGDGRVLQDKDGMEQLLLELMEELGRRDSFAAVAAEGAFSRLVSAACRKMLAAGAHESSPGDGAAVGKTDLAYETVRFIDRHLLELRELGQIAEALGYSYSHLSHVFRLEMGGSLQSYWNRKRILYAMKLLQSGERSITRIAETLHYQSVHSFSKAFKKISGLSPTDYQELYGREHSD